MAETFGVGRAIFRAMVPDLYGMAFSANAMIRQARSLGISYRRQNMLSDIRQLTGRLMKETLVRAVPATKVAPRGVMVETELTRARKYFVQGDAQYHDLVTGEDVVKPASFYSDDLKTYKQWERDYERWKEEERYRIDLKFVGFRPRSISHNVGWSY